MAITQQQIDEARSWVGYFMGCALQGSALQVATDKLIDADEVAEAAECLALAMFGRFSALNISETPAPAEAPAGESEDADV
jgi:hypothetical protein